MDDNKCVELKEVDIMLRVPADACALELTAIMIDKDYKTYEVSRRISPAELSKAREDFLTYIGDDYDATYVITEKGREWLDSLDNET